VNRGKSSRLALSKLLDSMGRCKMAVTKLKRENIQQWFTPDEAARYIFEGDDIDATALDEYLENQELKLYCKVKETSTIQIIDPAQLGMFDKIFMVMRDKPQPKMRLIGNPLTLSNEVRIVEPSEYEFYEPVARYGIEASLECGVYPVVKNKDGLIELELSKMVGTCFLINDTDSVADYMYCGILDNDLLAFDHAPKVIDYGTYFTIDAYQYENKTVEHNSIGGVKKSESLDLGFTRTELDRFIKAQTEPTPETKEPKELNTNERNSLHALIYALTLKDVEADMQSAIAHDADAKRTDTASKLKRRLDKQGINFTEKTIRNHIKSAHTTAQELKNSQ
jgi:hypothetical protein